MNIQQWMALLLCGLHAITSLAASPPNVVLIVADDLGYGDLGCYGSPTNRTLRIDQLAADGVRFTDFHSSGPMCTPTRVSILTGKYQQRFGGTFDGPLSGETQRELGLPADAVTIAERLKQHGYATACFGKWHLGFRSPHLPNDQGFHEFRGLLAGDGDHHSHIDRYGNEDWWNNKTVQMESGYTAELLTTYAIDFIQQHRDRPFFLYVPHLAIHFPWQGPRDPAHRVKGKDYKLDKWGTISDRSHVHPHVKAMVEAIDRSTGAIIDELQRLELDANTALIFTSDNGGYLNYGDEFQNISSNGKLRGQKGSLYEGGHRVPLIVSWVNKIKPAVSHAVAHSNDFMPTICNLAGIDARTVESDGLDLTPVFLRDADANHDGFSHRTLYWRAGEEWAIREGNWKLVFEQGRLELFDLETDIREQRDRSTDHPQLVERLRSAWQKWDQTMP